MCLAIACGNPLASSSKIAPNMSPKIANSTISSSARKYFFELGGIARLQSTVITKDLLSDLDSDVQFSGRMAGLSLYMSRLLRPIWQKRLFKEVGSKFVSAIKSSTFTSVQRHLDALNEFLELYFNTKYLLI